MSKEADRMRESAEAQKPKSLKRIAPSPKDPTAAEVARQQQRWGKPSVYRLDPDTRMAIDRAAQEHGVHKSKLVDFLLRAGLVMLATGRIDLESQREEEEQSKRLTLPDVPMAYRE